MLDLSIGQYVTVILSFVTICVVTGFVDQDPLTVNDFLYNIGVWEYVSS